MHSTKAVIVLLTVFCGTVLGSTAAAQSPVSPDGLRQASPVRCTGTDNVVLQGRSIITDGNAVETRSTCDIVIIGSYIKAGGVAVLVGSTGDVEIRNSHIEGAQGALLIQSTGDITYSDSRIVGGAVSRSIGDLVDRGGNDVSGRVSAAAGDQVTIGDGVVRVGDVVIDSRGVRTGGAEVRTDGGRVSVNSGGVSVDVDGNHVRIDSGSSVVVSGDWRVNAESRYSASDTDRILVELSANTEGDQVQLDLAGDVLFDFNSAAVRGDAAAQLAKVAHLLRERSAGEIYVYGHTDSIGADAANNRLSQRRAVAVMHWLNANESIPAHLMKGQGMGSKKPVAYNTQPDGSDNPDGRAKNRRVEIKFAAR